MEKLDKSYPISLEQKGIAQLLIILVIVLGIIVGVYLVQHPQIFKSKATLEGIDLSLQPSQITANPNSELTVSVFANTNNFNVSAAEIHIGFDPNQVDVRNIQKAGGLGVVLQVGQVTNNEAKIILGASPGTSFKGITTIATLTVVPKNGFTSTMLQFTNQTKVAAINHKDDVIRSLNPTTITLPLPSSSPTSSHSPSPSPFLTPSSSSPTRSTVLMPTTRLIPGQSQTPTPSSTPIQKSNAYQETPVQVGKPSNAFQLIQQRNTKINFQTPQFSPIPTPSPETPDISQVAPQIPVLREVINFFVSNLDRVFNPWEIR